MDAEAGCARETLEGYKAYSGAALERVGVPLKGFGVVIRQI